MGFWHTGYMEFHEYSGLEDFDFDWSPPQYQCEQCAETFDTLDELRKHRFESHPLRRPLLLVRGQELGTRPFRITATLSEQDVVAEQCDSATLNGEAILLEEIPRKLATVTDDVCRLILTGGDVSSEFTLDVQIASEEDLRGIETEFERIARRRMLDLRAIDDFIRATERFSSAMAYYDGICNYLYGVLAKERAPDSSLSYDAYQGKYSAAAVALADYDRPLSRMISGLVQFHFNHFASAIRLIGRARAGGAAARFEAWLNRRSHDCDSASGSHAEVAALESMLTDWETEQVVRWASRPLSELSQHMGDMETLLRRDIAEYDRVKLHLLLAEAGLDAGDAACALRHAKALRNLARYEQWAERVIRALSGKRHEYH